MPEKLLVLLFALFLASCAKRTPIYSKQPTNNNDYRVEYLFEHEGCKVYRFMDLGRWVYFTNCQGEAITQPDSVAVIRNATNRKQ